MPSVEWSAPETDPELAAAFLKWWHGSLAESAGGGRRWTSITQLPLKRAYNASLADLVAAIEDEDGGGLGALVHPVTAGRSKNSGNQDLYHHIGVTKNRPEQGSRGRGKDTDMIPGAWADFDIKDTSFHSWDHIYSVISDMDRYGIGPQGIVMTGSGGAHAYWRAPGGLAPELASVYTKRILRWVKAEYGITIDNVADPARIMRLPGSIRFPKPGETLDPVTVLMPRNKDEYADLGRLESITQDAWMAIEERTQEQRLRIMEDFQALDTIAVTELEYQGAVASALGVDLDDFYRAIDGDNDASWDALWNYYAFLEVFDSEVSWADVLIPFGWTKYGPPDAEGRQSWTRPGGGAKNPRSAITDWDEGPNMSLLSDAPETGLAHLHELAGDATRKMYKLTKARVMAELRYGGSMAELMRVWLQAHRETGWKV